MWPDRMDIGSIGSTTIFEAGLKPDGRGPGQNEDGRPTRQFGVGETESICDRYQAFLHGEKER